MCDYLSRIAAWIECVIRRFKNPNIKTSGLESWKFHDAFYLNFWPLLLHFYLNCHTCPISAANAFCDCLHPLACRHTRPWNNLENPRKGGRKISEPISIVTLVYSSVEPNANKPRSRLNTGLCFIEDLCHCRRCLLLPSSSAFTAVSISSYSAWLKLIWKWPRLFETFH